MRSTGNNETNNVFEALKKATNYNSNDEKKFKNLSTPDEAAEQLRTEALLADNTNYFCCLIRPSSTSKGVFTFSYMSTDNKVLHTRFRVNNGVIELPSGDDLQNPTWTPVPKEQGITGYMETRYREQLQAKKTQSSNNQGTKQQAIPPKPSLPDWLTASTFPSEVRDAIVCPLTGALMKNPLLYVGNTEIVNGVLLEKGKSYDGEALMKKLNLQGNIEDSKFKYPKSFYPNTALANIIDEIEKDKSFEKAVPEIKDSHLIDCILATSTDQCLVSPHGDLYSTDGFNGLKQRRDNPKAKEDPFTKKPVTREQMITSSNLLALNNAVLSEELNNKTSGKQNAEALKKLYNEFKKDLPPELQQLVSTETFFLSDKEALAQASKLGIILHASLNQNNVILVQYGPHKEDLKQYRLDSVNELEEMHKDLKSLLAYKNLPEETKQKIPASSFLTHDKNQASNSLKNSADKNIFLVHDGDQPNSKEISYKGDDGVVRSLGQYFSQNLFEHQLFEHQLNKIATYQNLKTIYPNMTMQNFLRSNDEIRNDPTNRNLNYWIRASGQISLSGASNENLVTIDYKIKTYDPKTKVLKEEIKSRRFNIENKDQREAFYHFIKENMETQEKTNNTAYDNAIKNKAKIECDNTITKNEFYLKSLLPERLQQRHTFAATLDQAKKEILSKESGRVIFVVNNDGKMNAVYKDKNGNSAQSEIKLNTNKDGAIISIIVMDSKDNKKNYPLEQFMKMQKPNVVARAFNSIFTKPVELPKDDSAEINQERRNSIKK